MYINGVLQSSKHYVYPGTMFPGGYYGSQGDGQLDEVRIWNVARTQAQIAANKDEELTGPQTGLVGYWPMNEGTGMTLHDVSGSGRDVDLTSAGYTSANWTNGRYSVASIIGSYRYGFNGQEHSTEIDEDNDYTAQFWEYDSRIGRRWNIDPKSNSYESVYSTFANNPLIYTDVEGDVVQFKKGEGFGKDKESEKNYEQAVKGVKDGLRKNSKTFNNIYKDLDEDKNRVYTVIINNSDLGGDAGKTRTENGIEYGDISVSLTPSQNGEPDLNTYLGMVAHEFGHAWRKKYNLDPPLTGYKTLKEMMTLITNLKGNDFETFRQQLENDKNVDENVRNHKVQETEANHIANIVLSELIKSKKKEYTSFALFSVYTAGKQASKFPIFVLGKSYVIKTVQPADYNTLEKPRDKEYYMNNQFDIYKNYNVTKKDN